MVVIKVDIAVDTRVVIAVEKRVVITVVLIMVTDVIAGDTCLEDIIRKTYFSYGK
jgi:methyl coenzyme M reductase subunit C